MATNTKANLPTELVNRILFTIFMLAIYRLGVAVPTPGVDGAEVTEFIKSQSASIFGLFNTFTGGALERFSVFALGIMPYITASIIFQILQTGVPYLESLKKEGEAGRRKLNQYTRYLTVFLAIFQGYGIAQWLASNPSGNNIVTSPYFGVPFFSFELVTIVTLTAGTCFVMWIGEQIEERGIGSGSSLIIFAGIAASIPGGAAQLWQMTSSGDLSVFWALVVVFSMLAVVGAIVFMETGQRRIPVHYSMRGQGRQAMQTPQSHLPLKVNFAGVIPPIFASSLLMFPSTLTLFANVPWLQSLQNALMPTGAVYNVLFVALIVFFSFFYTEVVFNPNDVADNLKKYGGFIPGIRAGKSTADYIKKVLDRLTVTGCIYLSIVSISPTIFAELFKVPFYFGGTSLLILVGVALDTAQKIQSYLLTAEYDKYTKQGSAIRRVRLRSRRVTY